MIVACVHLSSSEYREMFVRGVVWTGELVGVLSAPLLLQRVVGVPVFMLQAVRK